MHALLKIFDVVLMLTAKYILDARAYTVGYSYTKTYTCVLECTHLHAKFYY